MGALRIRQELLAKGVEPALVNEAIGSLRATEFERARDVWQRKFGAPATDAQGRARQARFLAARGFGGDVIRRVIGGEEQLR
jgi:regulatory protein